MCSRPVLLISAHVARAAINTMHANGPQSRPEAARHGGNHPLPPPSLTLHNFALFFPGPTFMPYSNTIRHTLRRSFQEAHDDVLIVSVRAALRWPRPCSWRLLLEA